MQTRRLGQTDLQVPILSFGASSLGAEFRNVTLDEALSSVRVALDCGLNFIDTSPFYGRGMSEVLLGVALRGVPRDSYTLLHQARPLRSAALRFLRQARGRERGCVACTGWAPITSTSCSATTSSSCRCSRSSMRRLPALRKIQQAGKVRFIGFSGYPMKIFRFILEQTTVDCVLSYNQYTLQNTRFADEMVPLLKAKGVGAMNAGPFSARLLTNAPLPGVAEGAGRRESRGAPGRGALCEQGRRTSRSWRCSSPARIRTSRRPSPAAPTRRTSATGRSGPRSRSTRNCSPKCRRFLRR